MKKSGAPKRGEIVIGKVERITPYSVLVKLLEYDSMGMVHISEVSSGWVKDIRHYVHVGETVVAKVMKNDRSYLALSIRRVSKNQKAEKIKEYNLERRAEKMFSIVAKKLSGKDKVMKTIVDNFGSIYKVFELAAKKPELLVKKGIPEDWAREMGEFFKNNVKQKTFEFKCVVEVSSIDPKGVDKVKKVLTSLEKLGTEVIYISSPKYLMRFTTQNPKEGEKLILKATKKFESAISKYGCEGSITRV